MNEFRVTDQGELDLDLAAPAASPQRAARPPRRATTAAAGTPCPAGAPPPDDDWPAGDWPAGEWDWEPAGDGDPDTDPDDYQAWLAGLPAGVRADFLAGAWTGAGESIPAGFVHHLRGGPSGTGFAAGGVLDTLAPGPWLADALTTATAAAGGGHGQLGESELIGVLCGWRRIASWAAAGEAAAVLTLARRRAAATAGPAGSRQAEHVTDEIAAALTLTGRSAGRLLTIASGLARTPDVLTALKAGGIDWPKAAVFADELAPLDDTGVAAAIAARYLGRAGAGGWTTGQLRAALRRAVLAADPAAAGRRRADARADAAVTVWDEASGNAALAGRELPPAEVLTADARLTALAKWLQARGAPGTISQLRAAVYTALLNGRPIDSLLPDASASEAAGPDDSVPGGEAPAAPAVSGSIHLTMPLSAFLGSSGEPGEVAGHGPVDAATSRDLARILGRSAGTRWCLTVTGADGRAAGHACSSGGPAAGQPVITSAAGLRGRLQILETGSCRHARQAAGYIPPSTLRHLIGVRQRRCSHPGCRRPAARCDLDHTIPYDHGGITCECNLAPLCRHHHRCKQADGWHLDQRQPGEMTWRTPSGRVYQTSGDPY